MQYQPSQSTRISCIKFHTDTSAFTEATACKVRRTDIHPEINFGLWAFRYIKHISISISYRCYKLPFGEQTIILYATCWESVNIDLRGLDLCF